MDDESVGSGESSSSELLLIRVRVPELNVEKCLQFQRDQLVWEVKQQTLAAIPKVNEYKSGYKNSRQIWVLILYLLKLNYYK